MKNKEVRDTVIIDVAIILLFNFFCKYCVNVFVAIANNIDTHIAFRNGLKSSIIKNIITIAIAIKKLTAFKIVFLVLNHHLIFRF